MVIDPIRVSIWKTNINLVLGTLLLASVALWAATVMIRAAYGINPVANAFAMVVTHDTQLPE